MIDKNSSNDEFSFSYFFPVNSETNTFSHFKLGDVHTHTYYNLDGNSKLQFVFPARWFRWGNLLEWPYI